MIVYYFQRTHGKVRAREFSGTVRFFNKSSRAVRLGTVGVRPKTIFKTTCFDDSLTPPLLVRCDYGFDTLRNAGATLPEFWQDDAGDIIRTCDDVVVMKGPGSTNESSRHHDKHGNELKTPAIVQGEDWCNSDNCVECGMPF